MIAASNHCYHFHPTKWYLTHWICDCNTLYLDLQSVCFFTLLIITVALLTHLGWVMLYESFNFINIRLENGLLPSKPLSGWSRDAYRYIRYDPGTGTTLYWSKVSKWGAQNDTFIDTNIWKVDSSNHKRRVHSNNLRAFRKRTLPWQSKWRSPLL